MTEQPQASAYYPCPCCGYYVFDEPPGSYAICPICFWEDDLSQLRFPTQTGANKVSLVEGQANFGRLGVCEERLLPYVRQPTLHDHRDPQWRPIDPASDIIEVPFSGMDYGATYPLDRTSLYYWSNHISRGYDIIDPGLALPGGSLSFDAQVRCLSYLIKRIGDVVAVPSNVRFEIIPAEYLGGPYPAIGMYSVGPAEEDKTPGLNPFFIEERLSAFIQQVGLERLQELSSDETKTWQDILSSFGAASG